MSEIISTGAPVSGGAKYIGDVKPRAVAALLHLASAARSTADRTATSAFGAAPALLDLLGMSAEGGVDSLIPMRELRPYDTEREDLIASVEELIAKLQSVDYVSHTVLDRMVLDTMSALRHTLVSSHLLSRIDPALGVRFSDRIWEVDKKPLAYRTLRSGADLASIITMLMLTLLMLPLVLLRNGMEAIPGVLTGWMTDPDAPTNGAVSKDKPVAKVATNAGDIRHLFGDMTQEERALSGRVAKARGDMLQRTKDQPHLHNERDRLERHLADLTRRALDVAATDEGLTGDDRAGVLRSLEMLATAMESLAGQSSTRAIDELRTEIRFIESAHGTHQNLAPAILPENRL